MNNITRSRLNEHYLKETLIRFTDLEELVIQTIREEVGKLIEVVKTENSPNKLFTVAQLGDRFNVSKKTVYNWINKKIIIGHKVGGKRLFSLKEIETKIIDPRYWDILEAKGLKEPRPKIF